MKPNRDCHKTFLFGAAVCMLATLVLAGCATGPRELSTNDLVALANDPAKYKPLLDADLSNAIMRKGGWAFEDGVLTAKGKGDIWTEDRYGDFALDLEFKCAPETNSGVFIRTDSIKNWLHTAIEVQILQPNDEYGNDKHHCGGIFDCLAPTKLMVKPTGEWNRFIIVARANKILAILNGEMVVDMDLDLWTEAHKNPDGTKNKFQNAYKDMSREGHIGLQYHGHPVWFRNLKVKPIR